MHLLVEQFLDALWMERGVAELTLQAYRSDLEKFALWLDERGYSLLTLGQDELHEYLAWRLDHGFKATSTARDRKSTRLNSSHSDRSRMPSSA